MGYYSDFSLEIIPENDTILKAIEHDETELAYIARGNRSKFYNHEETLVKISLKYPEYIFKLHGVGENEGDLWDKYFKNGKIQRCVAEIVIPPMTEDGWIEREQEE